MVNKSNHLPVPLLGLYRFFLGLVFLEGSLVVWLLFRIPSEAKRALLSGYSRLRISIGATVLFILFVIIFLLLDSFFSRRILKFFAFRLAAILAVNLNRTIIKVSPVILLIISLPFAGEYNLTSLGGNALLLIGLFIGYFLLICMETFILYSAWVRKDGQLVSTRKRVMPFYYKDGIVIFCLLAFIFAYFYQDGGWNGNSRFDLIFAVVQERRLTIDTFQNQPGMATKDTAYFNGHYYSDKAVGPAALGAILYFPIYWFNRALSWNPNRFESNFNLLGRRNSFSLCRKSDLSPVLVFIQKPVPGLSGYPGDHFGDTLFPLFDYLLQPPIHIIPSLWRLLSNFLYERKAEEMEDLVFLPGRFPPGLGNNR
jgi:hypothetical protein